MASFKKTNLKIYTKTGPNITPDTLYWKKLGVPALVKEFGPIDYIDFSPVEPHYFAVTCSVRVQVYNPITKVVQKNLSRFRETAYGGSFRSDGNLICVGGDECQVKLFDASSKSLLRVFKGHASAVHRCFFTLDKTHIASFSDDKSVCLWDIPSESKVTSFSEHSDYVRAGAVSPVSTDIILSGGYDNIVRMYDTRVKASVFSVDHGAAVESVIFLPTGGIFLSAGGTEIRVWDAFTGGRLLAKLCQHHKTVTCLCLGSGNKRFLSGSLDRHVKIYDVSTYQVAHTLDYPNAVLSLDVSPGDETVVAGMVDGLVSISRREDEIRPTKQERKKVSYRYAPDGFQATSVDTIIPEEKKELMSKHDACLRRFQYSKAVDCVLMPYITNKKPAVTVCLFQELIRRKGLKAALAGREGKSLSAILRFLIKYIGDYRFTRTLIDVANMLLDTYDVVDLDMEIGVLFHRLARRLREEEQLTEELLSLQGAIQLLLSGAGVGESDNTGSRTSVTNIQPSQSAQSNFIVNLT
ncbi:U3 small nucleolar RNA-associated protein 15 homolog [Zootermopsis nevadensis]|uniref:U3 small nucleolar RNA-associated protein 15 homolog n=1 Tax=Zootermopsis nevadensis TaxID=136037 RepID=A0A067RXA6_ZOONE|nr:U3 small nucleolar RNA-associated protein 15 homolog [Zootermopsis nevadensis]KDR24524.1 U3 small nucleolar RNA-associated protein 15-like protein [Zootermopsis nevadensis]